MSEKNYIIELIEGRCEDPKARIFKAALEEFGMRSLAGARTREIAAKANLNHAAINYYFGGKNELYMELALQIRDFIKVSTALILTVLRRSWRAAIRARRASSFSIFSPQSFPPSAFPTTYCAR